MEKEQKKLSTGVVILIITLVVALVTVSTLFALELLKEDDVNKQQITGEDSELKEEEDNVIESRTKIFYLNGKKHKVEVDILKGEAFFPYKDMTYAYYKWKYSVKIDGIEVKNLEEVDGGEETYDNYKISKMSDNNHNEYIVLEVYTGLMSGGIDIDVYIIDESADVLGKIKHSGKATYAIDIDGDGEIHNQESVGLETYWYDMIIDYKKSDDGKTFEKHIYTIENGKFVDKIDAVYKEGEFEAVAGQIE